MLHVMHSLYMCARTRMLDHRARAHIHEVIPRPYGGRTNTWGWFEAVFIAPPSGAHRLRCNLADILTKILDFDDLDQICGRPGPDRFSICVCDPYVRPVGSIGLVCIPTPWVTGNDAIASCRDDVMHQRCSCSTGALVGLSRLIRLMPCRGGACTNKRDSSTEDKRAFHTSNNQT